MTGLVEIRRCRTRAEAEQHVLTLLAVGIECRAFPVDGRLGIYVAARDAERAREQLTIHEAEHVVTNDAAPSIGEWEDARDNGPRAAIPHAGWGTVIAYAVVMVLFFVADNTNALSVDWARSGAVQAGLIFEGEWWRTLTALTLHGDFGHLLSNLLFGIVAALAVTQLLGSGLGWAAIVLAGALGNGLNAFIQSPEHTSLGASTAVFGALGILSGYRQISGSVRSDRGLRRWAPIAAGIMLVIFLGFGGENTDVMAHVLGFAAGVGIGFALGHVPPPVISGAGVQRLGVVLTCGLLSLAWGLALVG